VGWLSNLLGTSARLFGIGQAVIDADAMTAPHTHALQNKGGTLAHLEDIPAVLDYLDPSTTTTEQLIDALIAGGWMAGPTPAVPSNTVLPAITGGSSVGAVLSLSNGTWTGSPTSYAKQWQEDIAGTWTDIAGETGDTYTTDHAGSFRGEVIATNAVGSSAPAYSAAKAVTEPSTLPSHAVRFAGDTAGALGSSKVGAGDEAWTVLALVYLEPGDRLDYCTIFANLFNSGRLVTLATNNAFGVWPVSISNNQGTTTPFSTDMSQGAWYLVSLGGDAPAGNLGQFRATYQPLSGGSLVSVTVQKGEFFSTPDGIGLQLAGGGDLFGWPDGARFNWVRAYDSFLTESQIEALLESGDPTGALFWWEFTDNGSGGVAVADLTGNGLVPTVTDGTLADGPGA
jgi:hypothetical protein